MAPSESEDEDDESNRRRDAVLFGKAALQRCVKSSVFMEALAAAGLLHERILILRLQQESMLLHLLTWLGTMNRSSSATSAEPAHVDAMSSTGPRAVDLRASKQPPTPRPEWALLVAASSPAPRGLATLRSYAATPVDWDAILQLADQHGTSSLAYQNLAQISDVVPAQPLATLRERHRRNIHKSLFLTRELIRILDCLQALGIEVVPYKGVVLSQMLYGDPALRQSGDIDLFVRKQDVPRIKRAVGELGFVPRFTIPVAAERDYIAAGYELTFDSPAGKNLLELQWALQPRFYAVDFDMDGLFQRAVCLSVAGHPMKTPSLEDLLLVLSVHAAKHVWGRLIWLCDIAQILRQPNLNWDLIKNQSEELGIERILCLTLLLANRFLAAVIPSAMEESIARDNAALKFADEISTAVARGTTYEDQQVAYFRLMMRLRERRADRVRFLTRLTFTPGPGEWEAVRLPAPLFPFYRLVRLGRLAARFARG
jgi:hypothetical protein